ncbi:MAG: AmmeMemoRadiSam system protein B [Armatimonadetes bacterium]|nr:AmmeMemoRadiSam system protein B [Armatimonadota bacterium]
MFPNQLLPSFQMNQLRFLSLLLSLFWLASVPERVFAGNSIQHGVRAPAVAGSFYPTNPDTLRRWVGEFLRTTTAKPVDQEIVGVVAPHAGYPYSGWVAGETYRQLQGKSYDAIIIISPSHYRYFYGASVFNGLGYATPLGVVRVDTALARLVATGQKNVGFSEIGHAWDSASPEHSIEVQLPFLQTVQPGVPIVPVVMGSQDFPSVDRLMRAVVRAVRASRKRVLLVASSDLSHYHRHDTATVLDSSLIGAFSRFDYHLMGMRLFGKQWEACGGGPVMAVMMAAEQLGATQARPLRYMNSSNVAAGASRPDRVVGYLSGLILKGNTPGFLLPTFTDAERAALLKVARSMVETSVNGVAPPAYRPLTAGLAAEYPAFVTITKRKALRGCIGYVIPDGSLLATVQRVAPMAALKDSRFQPITPAELPELEYEVTVLSRFRRVMDTAEIQPGRDGVYLRVGTTTGLFLPQVATEQGWDRTILLQQLGLKAGLDTEAYRREEAELYRFEAVKVE